VSTLDCSREDFCKADGRHLDTSSSLYDATLVEGAMVTFGAYVHDVGSATTVTFRGGAVLKVDMTVGADGQRKNPILSPHISAAILDRLHASRIKQKIFPHKAMLIPIIRNPLACR